jgi:hypothetical protein
MTDIADQTLDILGELVALANTPSYLWRKLSERPTIEVLSERPSLELETELRLLIEKDALTERELTLAYALLVAWLLQGPAAIERAREVPGLFEKLPLARGVIRSRIAPGISLATISHRASPVGDSIASTPPTSLEIIRQRPRVIHDRPSGSAVTSGQVNGE